MNFRRMCACSLGLIAVLFSSNVVSAQEFSNLERDEAQGMLQVTANDVRKHYYDSKFHGVDWDATVAKAKQEIKESTSMNTALGDIAAALDVLNDSHTFFLPPQHAYHLEYGWQYQMVGDHCFVTEVRPGSDAESKGLKAGDEVLGIDGFKPTRGNLWRIEYLLNALRPQPGLRVDFRTVNGAQRTVDVMARVRQMKRVTDLTGENGASDIWNLLREGETADHLMRARWIEVGDDLLVLKLPEFSFSSGEIDDMIGKAHKRKALILDLRGNPGGSVETLKYVVGDLFDKEVKIADRVGRKEGKPIIAKPRHSPFTGKLIVLVDHRSASAAELLARVVQLEKRGTVIGDGTSGSVMEAEHYSNRMGTDTVIFYGASITDADLIMTDGKSLEHVGVTPEETVLPTAQDLASGRDPVIAHAAEMLGVKVTPENAGKMFPYEWAPN
jgi:C-terminal processing protease CtpA/Prc